MDHGPHGHPSHGTGAAKLILILLRPIVVTSIVRQFKTPCLGPRAGDNRVNHHHSSFYGNRRHAATSRGVDQHQDLGQRPSAEEPPRRAHASQDEERHTRQEQLSQDDPRGERLSQEQFNSRAADTTPDHGANTRRNTATSLRVKIF